MTHVAQLEFARAEMQRQHSSLVVAVVWLQRDDDEDRLRASHHIGIVEAALRELDVLIRDARRSAAVHEQRAYQEHGTPVGKPETRTRR